MEDARQRGRRERMRQRQQAVQARMDRLSERAQNERGRRGWVDAIFEVVDRDDEVAGGIIAGALAYRLFIWLLPLGLVFVGGLGVVADVVSDSPKHIGTNLGIEDEAGGQDAEQGRAPARQAQDWSPPSS